MSVTRLKRKHRKNIARANNETRKIKNLLRTPVLKNVDLDELKSKFGQATPPDAAAKSPVAPAHQEQPAAQPTEAKPAAKQEAPKPETKAEAPKPEAKAEAPKPEAAKAEAPAESLLDKVTHAATTAAEAVKHAASGAVEAVTHNSLVEKVTDAVVHNSLVEKATGAVQEAAHNVVEGAKHVLESQSPENNQATQANQTGTTGFDAAEAVTKPVTEEGQAGEHPKPEIAL
ncbi:hypothetical protein [Hymenobacter psoromatis]|uniref:hypothetical protein n=1 Tax=Hymenobacter psoromatis TaxID=1484116 RepID=UPI001CBADF73|nr:hypothetical protein [Hymenobacter psoromatis]